MNLQSPLLNLRSLNLGYNNLLALPHEACSVMPNLEVLLLPNNLLEWLPRELTGAGRVAVARVVIGVRSGCALALQAPEVDGVHASEQLYRGYWKHIKTRLSVCLSVYLRIKSKYRAPEK